MPFTSNMQFEVPARGTFVGVWDTPVNGDFNIIDSAFGSVSAIALSNSPVALTDTQAQASVLRFSGVLTANVAVTIPSTIRKFWIVENNTTGNFVVTLTNGSGQVIGLPPGDPVDVYSDGTDVKFRNLGRIGSYLDIASLSVPSWILACTTPPYLNCDGSAFSPVTYPYLTIILNSTLTPDLRGVMRATLNQGTNRITIAGSGINGDSRFSFGGAQNVPILQSNLPSVNFPVADPGHGHAYALPSSPIGGNISGGGAPFINNNASASGNTVPSTTGIVVGSGGSGVALNNMPPTTISGITLIRAA
jgi:hypothetical protein